MDNFDKTVIFKHHVPDMSISTMLTIFDESHAPVEYDLSAFSKSVITFGRDEGNDIVIRSSYVSRQHGYFKFIDGGWVIENNPSSTNGLIYNNSSIEQRLLADGDSIRIDDGVETTKTGVLLMFGLNDTDAKWFEFPVPEQGEITIGRGESCDIRLHHISVSSIHAKIQCFNGEFYLVDNGSTNGIMINGRRVAGRVRLQEKDLILITNSKLIFSSNKITYCCYKKGINVKGFEVVKRVGRKLEKTICNSVDLHIKPREMIAIVGGSGAGKSTVMNCLAGYSRPTSGNVAVNGVDLYDNFDALKNIIGYVPQADIVYDNLTVYHMLMYAARLRLPADVTDAEVDECIGSVIRITQLDKNKDTFIKSLSGGQRKRASIAVELLSDPNLFFLDEPASGLDPGTERNLMLTLRTMAQEGKTVIFVTHSTLNLHLCDKIAFMGTGGNLCFFGSYREALEFFGVDDIVDVYNMISDEAEKWKGVFHKDRQSAPNFNSSLNTQSQPKDKAKKEAVKQTVILTKRHLHIMINDRIRLGMLILQAPLLAVLISIVADGRQYDVFGMTNNILFALSCSAVWIGILNSIQEICKERVILKREYMTGLRLDSYILSKTIVMALMCAVQSFLLVTVFAFVVGLPHTGVFLPSYIEFLLAIFFTTLASSGMGLLVSSLFKNADRAMTVAPLLLLPQLLFSGLIFALEGATQVISYFVVCRWSMGSLGTIADLNFLRSLLPVMPGASPPEPSSIYTYTFGNLAFTWLMMFLFVIVLPVIGGLSLRGMNKEGKS
jgi:ABC-type multidrug transport system ATPase subunit